MSERSPDGWELRGVGGVELLICTALEAVGADVAITGRRGGTSRGPYRSLNLGLHVGDDPVAVVENRRRAAAAFGARPGDLVLGAQVHGAGVAAVGDAHRGRGMASSDDALPGVDALVTDRPGPVLVSLAADCVPVALVDPAAGVLATVHAGWRGVAAGVVEAALRRMGELGARPSRMEAGIGPAVSARTYQVGDEVAAAVRRHLARGGAGGSGDASDDPVATGAPEYPDDPATRVLVADGPGHWLLDMSSVVRHILHREGVAAEAVHMAATSTGSAGPFFSDREVRPCGRFGLLARLRP